MRVIAGDFKGFRLRPVQGMKTRPTSDKVKETIFNMIGPYFDGGRCLDLFAGSGSLGIEALSRGKDETIFVEKNQNAVNCIIENVKHVKSIDRTNVLRMDAFKAIPLLVRKKEKFDLIFLDPPYDEIKIDDLLQSTKLTQLSTKDGMIVAEHQGVLNIDNDSRISIMKEKKISKTTTITILKVNND